MNKTVQIQLGGRVFFIEEQAFDTLKAYLDKLESHYSGSPEAREIIRDIEGRLAELALERLAMHKAQALTAEDLEVMLETMGDPWEEDEAPEGAQDQSEPEEATTNPHRRLFRDPKDKILGGVCSGFSHYLGLDPILLRLLFLIAFFIFGSGVILYILLWIVMPEAKTRAEQLQMRGEPVNARNLGQQVRDEVHKVKKQVAHSQVEVKNAAQKITGLVRELFEAVGVALKGVLIALGKIFGLFFVLIGLLVMAAVVAVSMGFEPMFLEPGGVFDPFVLPKAHWEWLRFTIPLSVFIPALLLALGGLRLLLDIRWGNKWVYGTMGLIWLGLVGYNLHQGSRITLQFREEVRWEQKEEWTSRDQGPFQIHAGLPASVGFEDGENKKKILLDAQGTRTVHMGSVMAHIRPESKPNRVKVILENTRDTTAWIKVRAGARGASTQEANNQLKEVNYRYKVQGNELWLSPSFEVPEGMPWAAQEVEVIVGIPEGRKVVLDEELSRLGSCFWRFRDCQTRINGSFYYELYSGPDGIFCPTEHNGENIL